MTCGGINNRVLDRSILWTELHDGDVCMYTCVLYLHIICMQFVQYYNIIIMCVILVYVLTV